jgi:hypothetical protein
MLLAGQYTQVYLVNEAAAVRVELNEALLRSQVCDLHVSHNLEESR